LKNRRGGNAYNIKRAKWFSAEREGVAIYVTGLLRQIENEITIRSGEWYQSQQHSE
jgi:hypothetical protein